MLAYTVGGNDLSLAVWVAVAVGALITVFRVIRRETLQFALAGFAGVALSAFIADRTGKAEDFFLPGLLLNAAYAGAYLVSIAIRRPLLGVLLAAVLGEKGWREDPERVRVYTRASWIWVGVFTLRLAVQLPLYLSDRCSRSGSRRRRWGCRSSSSRSGSPTW